MQDNKKGTVFAYFLSTSDKHTKTAPCSLQIETIAIMIRDSL